MGCKNMKIFGLPFFFILISSSYCFITKNDKKWYEPYINHFKNSLKIGPSLIGFPKIDPYYVNNTFVLENSHNRIHLNLQGLLSNFSDFYFNKIDVKPDLHTTLEVQLTAVSFLGNYGLNAEIMKVLPLMGNGKLEIFVGNVILQTGCKVLGKNRTLQITDFKFNYDIGVSKIAIDGLLEKYRLQGIFKNLLSDIVPVALNVFKSHLQVLIDQVTLEFGNKFLSEMDPKHIIEMLKEMYF